MGGGGDRRCHLGSVNRTDNVSEPHLERRDDVREHGAKGDGKVVEEDGQVVHPLILQVRFQAVDVLTQPVLLLLRRASAVRRAGRRSGRTLPRRRSRCTLSSRLVSWRSCSSTRASRCSATSLPLASRRMREAMTAAFHARKTVPSETALARP